MISFDVRTAVFRQP